MRRVSRDLRRPDDEAPALETQRKRLRAFENARSQADGELVEGLATLAFPAISCGAYGYPIGPAAEVAVATLARALFRHAGVRSARLVLFSEELRVRFHAVLERLRAAA